MTEALFTTLLVAAVLAMVLATREPRQRWLVLAGLTIAAAALVRPVAQPLLLLAVLSLLGSRPCWRSLITGLLLVGIGYGIVVGPWVLRDALSGESASVGALGQTLVGRTARHDRRDPALDSGFVFYDPARDVADPDPTRLAARSILQEAANRGSSGRAVHTRLKKELGLSDAAADQLMQSLAVEAIVRRPGYYLAGSTLRFLRLWTASPERLTATANEQNAVRREWEHKPSAALLSQSPERPAGSLVAAESLTTIFQPSFLGWGLPLLFVLGLTAAIVERRYRATLVPAMATLLLTALSSSLVGGVARYRYPEDPLILVVSSVGLAWVAGAARRRLVRVDDCASAATSSDLQGARRIAGRKRVLR
jgi:hypothetical protein